MQRAILIIPMVLLPATWSVQADDNLALLVHGASIHFNCEKGKGPKSKTCDLENFNPGLGAEWTFLGGEETGRVGLRGGIYRDSYRDTAYYAGAVYRKEWQMGKAWQWGAGIQAGYLNGSGIDGFAFLPFLVIGYQRLSLEVGYAPKMDGVPGRSHSDLVSFTLHWRF